MTKITDNPDIKIVKYVNIIAININIITININIINSIINKKAGM